MWDDKVQAEIRRAWDDWQDKLTPDDMRFLENAAADVAMLASDESVRARFRDALAQFAAQYAAFRTAREAWDAKPRRWRAEMGKPTNPLGAIWSHTYGTGWKGWQDLEPAGLHGRIWSPLRHEIEKEVPWILGAYALLAVIHDKILPQSPRINDGFLPEDLAQKIWCSFLNDVDNWGITGGRAQYVINKRHVESALARVTQDAKSEPQHAPIGKPEEKLNERGQADGTTKKAGRGGRTGTITRDEANMEVRRLLKETLSWEWTVRTLAERIGCSAGLISECPAWKAYNERRSQLRKEKKIKTVSLTSEMETVLGAGEPNEVLQQLIAEQEEEGRGDARRAKLYLSHERKPRKRES